MRDAVMGPVASVIVGTLLGALLAVLVTLIGSGFTAGITGPDRISFGAGLVCGAAFIAVLAWRTGAWT